MGDRLRVSADVLKEGHELTAAEARFRKAGRRKWTVHPMTYSYSKATPSGDNPILVVVNLDPQAVHTTRVQLERKPPDLDSSSSYHVQDLSIGARYPWRGLSGWVSLDPSAEPVHIFRLEEA